MSEFILQPNVYGTGRHYNLIGLMEDLWIRKTGFGQGTYYLLSGFGNYNGGVRFYSTFKAHTDSGGEVICFFGGSTSQRLTSKQLVERLLNCGCKVHVINRKQLFHTKCYGTSTSSGDNLIVTSGNFTGRGISHNVESSVYLDIEETSRLAFHWLELERAILEQKWEMYEPTLENPDEPGWRLLYNEFEESISIDETQFVTMVVTLGHSDTARINAKPSSSAGKGTQYFWLSRDSYDFFPPLTILNERGYKTTNSCLINLHYVDLGILDRNSRVTFEAGNNVDFRLRTSAYRYTGIAKEGDLAAISRISEYDYEIRIIKKDTPEYRVLKPYAITFIGHRGKQIGYMPNEKFEELLGIALPSVKEFERIPATLPQKS